ncbi:MAG: class I SAM-dependent RNA methyltransferase [Chloroflexi bacterium]|nr:class I SAM-dependent RNA methyltransferase [Chloroflexota bacterium]
MTRRQRRAARPTGPRERVRLELSGVAHGGEAIGRLEGRVVFVPYGLPGETVVAEIVQDKGDYARAQIVEIETASPDRVQPPCVYFGTCGGCQWQHAGYPAQLRFKQDIVAEQLRRIGGYAEAERLVLPTIGMDQPWHYRNHARFSVGRKYGELCFTRLGTRQLLRIDHCWLMQPTINGILGTLQRRLPGFRAHQLAIRVGANTGDLLINPALPPLGDPLPLTDVVTHAPAHHAWAALRGAAPDAIATAEIPEPDAWTEGPDSAATPEPPDATGPSTAEPTEAGTTSRSAIPQNVEREAAATEEPIPSGQPDLHEQLLGRRFRVAAPAFFQVNTRREHRAADFPTEEIAHRFADLIPVDGLSMAETLVLVALECLDLQPDDVIVDAYCGVGTFAAILAPLVRSVVGIEESPAAVKDAQANCRDLPNARFIAGKTEDVLPRLEERPTKVLLDPARVGCDAAVLEALTVAQPERIVYVSCEPATLARDLAILREGGYVLQHVQPIDMFPQTYHVESVSLLVRPR